MRAVVEFYGREMTLTSASGRERLAVSDRYPASPLSGFLFSQFGLMHLIAAKLPRVVYSNFLVAPPTRRLIARMYASERRREPRFIEMVDALFDFEPKNIRRPSPDRVAISYSGGKDSIWNLWRAEQKYGSANALAVHIHGLNRANSSRELRFAKRQAKKFPIPNFKTIKIVNGSAQKGYSVMRSRDIFMVGLIIPLALDFGASQIWIEGFAETSPGEPFSGQEREMRRFNRTLRELGLPIAVAWKNRQEMAVVKDLAVSRPEWLAGVCNCFSMPNYQIPISQSWERNAPSFTLFESQCGSCVKCRITNLGRLLYDPKFNPSPEDARYFVRTTVRWVKRRKHDLGDMIEGSFADDLKRAVKKFGVA